MRHGASCPKINRNLWGLPRIALCPTVKRMETYGNFHGKMFLCVAFCLALDTPRNAPRHAFTKEPLTYFKGSKDQTKQALSMKPFIPTRVNLKPSKEINSEIGCWKQSRLRGKRYAFRRRSDFIKFLSDF